MLSSAIATGALAISSIDILSLGGNSRSSLRLAATDFDSDKTRTNVYDPTLDGLKQASGILCFFSQGAYAEMAGKGPYIAQADMDTCFNEGGHSSSSSGGQQSSGKQKNLTTLVVESIRESDRLPLIVKGWFEMDSGGSASSAGASTKVSEKTKMQIKLVIVEGQSEQNPLGIFRLTWECTLAGEVVAKGFVESKRSTDSGKISLSFIDESGEGEYKYNQSLASILDYDSAQGEVVGGVIRTLVPNWDSPSVGTSTAGAASETTAGLTEMTSKEYLASFNTSRFLRKDVKADASKCLAKDEFDYNVYRYGLYDASTGARKELNSGFPVTITQNNETIYGWAGYWGVWLGDSTVTDGMTVKRIDYNTNVEIPYTVKAAPGKLLKRTKETLPLTKLAGVEFNVYDSSTYSSVIISYNAALNKFQKIGKMAPDGTTEYLANPENYSLQNAYGEKFANYFWSQAFGGSVVIYSDVSGGIVGTDAHYYKEENVTGTSGNLTLYCYQTCLKGNITDSTQTYYDDYNNSVDWSNPAAAAASLKKTYTFNAATMQRIDASNNQVVKFAANVQGSAYSGSMTVTELNDPWSSSEQVVVYTYQTGSFSGMQYIALRDANGQAVSFDAPMFIKYNHVQANDRSGAAASKYYDKPYLLTYDGFGSLWGIPSGADANGFWKAQFALKDGALVGDSNQYKAKALDMELAMKEKDLGECGSLSTATPDLPSMDSFKSPAMGDTPSVTGAPSVVEGVVKVQQ